MQKKSNGRVVWVKQPEGYLPSGVIQQNNNLVITDARPDISGTYVCYLYTPQGEVQQILVINVPCKLFYGFSLGFYVLKTHFKY
jgi:hypothetical protein